MHCVSKQYMFECRNQLQTQLGPELTVLTRCQKIQMALERPADEHDSPTGGDEEGSDGINSGLEPIEIDNGGDHENE